MANDIPYWLRRSCFHFCLFVAMAYWSNVIVLMVGIVTMLSAAVLRPASNLFWPTLVAGLGLVVWALIADRHRKKRQERQIADHVAIRIRELTRTPWHANQRLVIPRRIWPIVAILLILICGSFLLYAEFSGPSASMKPVIAGAILLVFGIVFSPHLIAAAGRPTLVMDRQGIKTPIEGHFPWSAVEGISLQTMESRGQKSFVICFSVPSYGTGAAPIPWVSLYQSWFGFGALKRKTIGISLPTSPERPEVVEAVAKYLWTEATGRTHSWNPMYSPAANESLRRLDTLKHRIDASLATASEQAARKDQEGFLESAQQAVADLKQFNEKRVQFSREVDKQDKVVKWAIVLALLGIIASLALAVI